MTDPRMTTYLSSDKNMYEAYTHGKDLYAMIAQSAFDNNYEDNLEFWPEGTELEIDGQKVIAGKKTHLNKAGKERRSVGKVLNLAATYGMSGRTAGIRLNKSKEEGELLLTNFFKGFPGVKTAIDLSKDFLAKNGYVEDFVGRRRRLTDINLPPYTAELKIKTIVNANFNPFLICGDRKLKDDPVKIWNQILAGYVILSNAYQLSKNQLFEVKNEMSGMKFDFLKKLASNPSMLDEKVEGKWEKRSNRQKILDDMQVLYEILVEGRYKQGKTNCVFEKNTQNEPFYKLVYSYIEKYGLEVPTTILNEPMNLMVWTGKIAQASRQCFNARIQGSAATLTKIAMVDIANDPLMKQYGAHLIIPVHDELLVECSAEYADLVEKRLPELMIGAAKKAGDDVPQACDPYNVSRWYCDTAGAFVQEEFKKLEKKGLSRDEALAKVIANHSEVPEEAIIKTIETGCDLDF